jgi:exonuclease III
MDSDQNCYKILSWNVRGLNSSAKQKDVRQIISTHKPDLVCLQETKLSAFTPTLINSILGHQYEANFMFLPSTSASGGITLAAREPFSN